MTHKITGYELSRRWFDFCFENPEKISPNHSAIYFFSIEHCNRLGWKNKFGFPTQMTMDAIGIKKHQTYIRYFNDLVEWGFFSLIQKSTNQYSANIISLKSAMPKTGKALDKAISKHGAKQIASIGQSNSSIDKQVNKEELLTNKQIPTLEDFVNYAIEKKPDVNKESVSLKYQSWVENNWKDGNDKLIKNWKSKLLNTLPYLNNATTKQNTESKIKWDNVKYH